MNIEQQRIREELIELQELRDLIDDRIQRLQHRLYAPVHRGISNGYSVVYSADLKPHIQAWIDDHKTLSALAEKCDVSEQTLRLILLGGRETVKESTADKILTALELPHIYNKLVPEPPESQFWEE